MAVSKMDLVSLKMQPNLGKRAATRVDLPKFCHIILNPSHLELRATVKRLKGRNTDKKRQLVPQKLVHQFQVCRTIYMTRKDVSSQTTLSS